ncbi:MAG: PH domain-containing protein, partial [Thermoanaerobaculia bacterium]|nr:PH domain-containing protein [Thermoanaerobaculia bacterium]
MANRETLTFPSKRDTWLVAVIWAAVVAMGFGIAAPWTARGFSVLSVLLTLLLVGGIALMLSTLYGTRYVIDGQRIAISAGPLRWRIDIGTIASIRPTNDPTSAPACSLDRLEIAWGDAYDTIMVSPADKVAFLEAVAARDAG